MGQHPTHLLSNDKFKSGYNSEVQSTPKEKTNIDNMPCWKKTRRNQYNKMRPATTRRKNMQPREVNMENNKKGALT